MALKPEMSLAVAAATGVLVYGIFQVELPSSADVTAAPAHNPFIKQSVNTAAWSAGVAVAGVSLLSKDPTVFVVGGTLAAFLTWRYKYANMYDPGTKQVTLPPQNAAPAAPAGSAAS